MCKGLYGSAPICPLFSSWSDPFCGSDYHFLNLQFPSSTPTTLKQSGTSVTRCVENATRSVGFKTFLNDH